MNSSKYPPGTFVTVSPAGDQLGVVEEVLNSHGFNEYIVNLVEEGKRRRCSSLDLSKFNGMEEFDDDVEVDFLVDIVIKDEQVADSLEEECEEDSRVPDEEAGPSKKKRFAQKTNLELDEMASNRHSSGTKKTTASGVRVFKGILLLLFFLQHLYISRV